MSMFEEMAALRDVCGKCTAYPLAADGTMQERATCEERGCIVAAKDPACGMYIEAG